MKGGGGTYTDGAAKVLVRDVFEQSDSFAAHLPRLSSVCAWLNKTTTGTTSATREISTMRRGPPPSGSTVAQGDAYRLRERQLEHFQTAGRTNESKRTMIHLPLLLFPSLVLSTTAEADDDAKVIGIVTTHPTPLSFSLPPHSHFVLIIVILAYSTLKASSTSSVLSTLAPLHSQSHQ